MKARRPSTLAYHWITAGFGSKGNYQQEHEYIQRAVDIKMSTSVLLCSSFLWLGTVNCNEERLMEALALGTVNWRATGFVTDR